MKVTPFPQYLNLRELVERGRYEQASSYLRKLRNGGSETEQNLRTLIATRIASKSNSATSTDRTWLDKARASDKFVEAEIRFTRGIVLYHEGSFELGAVEFEEARRLYQDQSERDRALLAGFNAYAGRVDTSSAQARVGSFDSIRTLEREAFELRNRKLLGLILREKSEVLQSLGRTAAAHEDALQAMRLIEIYGAKSDHDLAAIQAADCALDLERRHEARAIEQRVLNPIDRRVEFPLAMLRARLTGGFVHPKDFTSVVPVAKLKWKAQFGAAPEARRKRSTWNLLSGEIKLEGRTGSKKKITVRPSSLEGKLLRNLCLGKASKAALCEFLWPELCQLEILDNRLHRLISRMNAKIPALISFDGERYHLSVPLAAVEPRG